MIVMMLKLTGCKTIDPNNHNRQRSMIDSWWRLCKSEETAPELPYAKVCKTICEKWKTRKNIRGEIIKIECPKKHLMKVVVDLTDPENHKLFRSGGMRLRK